jgi:hypothetical protein
MNNIEDNELVYLDDNNNIDETIITEFAIILFQLLKNAYLQDVNPHLPLKRSISPKIKSHQYYSKEQEKLKILLDKILLQVKKRSNTTEIIIPHADAISISKHFKKSKRKHLKILKKIASKN